VPARGALAPQASATSSEILRSEINPLHPADHKLSRDGTGLPVTAVTLSDLVQDKANSRPALVKIDVQGAEMLVLEGADSLLRIADRLCSSSFMRKA
jgi:FkbM family methyltransferase